MQIEWDEAKRRKNIERHGVDFADIGPLFEGEIFTVIDDRFDYGETRYVTIGLLFGIALTVAHTENEETIRIISARRATKYEQEEYFEILGYGLGPAPEDGRSLD